MVNIIKDEYLELIKNELIRKELVESFEYNHRTKTVTMKTNLNKNKAELLATKAIMCLCPSVFGWIRVNFE